MELQLIPPPHIACSENTLIICVNYDKAITLSQMHYQVMCLEKGGQDTCCFDAQYLSYLKKEAI